MSGTGRVRHDRRPGTRAGQPGRPLGVVHRDALTRKPGCAHTSQRLSHDRRLAGLARAGDGDDSGPNAIVGQEANEVADVGALEGNHRTIAIRLGIFYNE